MEGIISILAFGAIISYLVCRIKLNNFWPALASAYVGILLSFLLLGLNLATQQKERTKTSPGC